MIETADLLPDLQTLVKLLHEDLRQRSEDRDDVADRLGKLHADRRKQQRSAQSYEEWREEFLTQVAVAWVLGCVFVRYLEDNRFLRDFHLAGPDAAALERARYNFTTFMHAHPDDAERNYLLGVFRRMQSVHGVADLFAPGKTALWAVEPSNTAAMKLLDFWHEIDSESGDLKRRFDTARGDTRFLGDLYQDLSADIRAKYALLQTPVFVEEFILDRTLEPAIAEFGFENVRLIDPTCGSGHFLLGAFGRLFRRWEGKWQETGDLKDTNRIDLAQRALNQVFGVDLNPYAVAICRFRLIIAALHGCELYDLESPDGPPQWKLNVAVGDSLYHGYRFDVKGERKPRQWGLSAESGSGWDDPYDMEDVWEVNRILGQQYHAVVGNPPYIVAKDKWLKKLYRELYQSCYRQFSLGVPFTERFFDLAFAAIDKHGPGYIGMITANSFMKREFGKVLIERFLKSIDLTHVLDCSGASIPGHSNTPTTILFGRNRGPVTETIRVILGIKGESGPSDDPSQGQVWQSIRNHVDCLRFENAFVSVQDWERSRLAKHPWSMGGGGAADLKELLDERADKLLGVIAESIGFASFTGLDEAFVIEEALARRYRLPADVVRRFIVGDAVRDWVVDTNLVALVPYGLDLELLPFAPNSAF
jgi:Eco57I restriction-modification methylase